MENILRAERKGIVVEDQCWAPVTASPWTK